MPTPRQILSGIIEFADQPGQMGRRLQSYGVAPLYGAALGAPLGLLLGGGKKSAAIGAGIGAIGSVATRAALGDKIDKFEHSPRPELAGALGVGPQLGMGAAGLGLFIKGGSILRGARKAGQATRSGVAKARKYAQDFNKGKVTVVDHIPAGAKMARSATKLLLSERREQITFARGDQVQRLMKQIRMPMDTPLELLGGLSKEEAVQVARTKGAFNARNKLTRAIKTMRNLSAREKLDSIINFKAMDLGYSYEDMGCSPCAPSESNKKHYPSLSIYDREDDLDLPLSGTATVRYKLRSKTARQDGEGKKRHSAEIEIQSIDPVKEVMAKAGERARPLNIGMRSKLESIISLGLVERNRNAMGMFSPDEGGGPDPNMIDATYKAPMRQGLGSQLAIGAGGSAIGAGGITGIKALMEKVKRGKVKLSAREKLDSIINFARDDEEEGSTFGKIATGAGALSGGYAGAMIPSFAGNIRRNEVMGKKMGYRNIGRASSPAWNAGTESLSTGTGLIEKAGIGLKNTGTVAGNFAKQAPKWNMRLNRSLSRVGPLGRTGLGLAGALAGGYLAKKIFD